MEPETPADGKAAAKAAVKTWDLTTKGEDTPPPPPPTTKKVIKDLDPKGLAEMAWGLINEAVQTKRITVPTGGNVTIDDEDYLRLLQWAAALKMKGKRNMVSKPEDFNLKETK